MPFLLSAARCRQWVLVWSKQDITPPDAFLDFPMPLSMEYHSPAAVVQVSSRTGEGLDKLLEAIGKRLDSGASRVTIHLPYDKGGILDRLYREAKVELVEYSETIDITAVCTHKTIGQLKDYVEGYTPQKEDWE